MFLEKKICRAVKTFSIANICTALNLFFSSSSVKGKQKGNILQIHECQCKIKMSELSSQSVCQSQKCFKVGEGTTWPGNSYSARSFWGEQFSNWVAAFRRGQAGFPPSCLLACTGWGALLQHLFLFAWVEQRDQKSSLRTPVRACVCFFLNTYR